MSDTPMTETLVQRLRGIYAVGKGDPPEFGFRHFDNLPAIQVEAANRIEHLERENADLRAKLEEARKDAERFLWMTADHDDVDVRERVVNLCNRLPTMSASAVRMYIDAAIAAGKGEK